MSTRIKAGRLLKISAAILLAVAGVMPALSLSKVSAAQVTARSITISSSKVSATGLNYKVSFKPSTVTGNGSDDIKGIVVDFCDSPLVATACTHPTGFSGVPTSSTIAVTHAGATGSPVSFTVNNPSVGGDVGKTLQLTDATGLDIINAGTPITFTITGITNPSTLGTFYARILTYNTTAGATSYTGLTPGTHLDDGGLAMSTSDQLTTTARVQEQLSFCVGGTTVDDATTSVATDCSQAFTGAASCGAGTTIDLGIIDNTATNVSPVASVNGGNGCNGAAMVQTNASNGVAVTYYAEPNGTNHTGALRVSGASCSAGVSNTDQCFNNNASETVASKGVEDFGVVVAGINCASVSSYTCTFGSGSYNMVRDTNYDDGAAPNNNYANEAGRIGTATTSYLYAWDDSSSSSSPSTLASSTGSSTKVVDNEVLILKYAATAQITTPTGQYSVTSTYVATPIY